MRTLDARREGRDAACAESIQRSRSADVRTADHVRMFSKSADNRFDSRLDTTELTTYTQKLHSYGQYARSKAGSPSLVQQQKT
jgi:hypothetical protein